MLKKGNSIPTLNQYLNCNYRGSPPYEHFGTWKKPCHMKFVLVADLSSRKTLCFYSTLYVESTCVNSFKHSLEFFKANKVKYWLNLHELLAGNICYSTSSIHKALKRLSQPKLSLSKFIR